MTTYHGQSAGHRASIWAERAAILVQHSSSILATRHARQFHALKRVGVMWSWTGRGVQRVVWSRGWIVGEMGGQHVVWQGGGSDGWDVEVLVAQTSHWEWLKGDREKDRIKATYKTSQTIFNLSLHAVVFLQDSPLMRQAEFQKLTHRDRACVDGQCCLQQSDNFGKINKNYIGDYRRPKCHETLMSEIIDGRDGKTVHHHYPAESWIQFELRLCVVSCSHSSFARAPITD